MFDDLVVVQSLKTANQNTLLYMKRVNNVVGKGKGRISILVCNEYVDREREFCTQTFLFSFIFKMW